MSDPEKTLQHEVLAEFDPATRQAVIAGLRARAIDPDVYGVLVWSGGWFGLHRWMLESPIAAVAQLLLVVTGLAFGLRGGLDLRTDDILLGAFCLLATGGWWIYDLATQKQAVLRGQVKREALLLERLSPNAIPEEERGG